MTKNKILTMPSLRAPYLLAFCRCACLPQIWQLALAGTLTQLAVMRMQCSFLKAESDIVPRSLPYHHRYTLSSTRRQHDLTTGGTSLYAHSNSLSFPTTSHPTMSSDHNTKPTLIMTGSGSDDCQVTSDPSNLDYKTTEEIAKEYGGERYA